MRELQPGDPQEAGPYRLLGRLGGGGMGQVFLGQSVGGRPIAVKIIRAELADDLSFRSRFAREVAAAQKVNGLYTAQVVDADTEGPIPWLVTAYVPGPSLEQAVAEHGPLPPAAVLTLSLGLAESLAAIHRAGIIHRDLKPSNVLLAHDGPRVIDFGISRAAEESSLTQSGFVVGSPGFMSPEQAAGEEVGQESDIFSLGSVITFAATGEGPFGTGSGIALLYRVVHNAPRMDLLPGQIRSLAERCLSKDPSERPTTDELLQDLQAASPRGTWLPASYAASFAQYRPSNARMEDVPHSPTVAAEESPASSVSYAVTASIRGQVPQASLLNPTTASDGDGKNKQSAKRDYGKRDEFGNYQSTGSTKIATRIATLTGMDFLGGLAFSPDSRVLAAWTFTGGRGDEGGQVTLWEVSDPPHPKRGETISHYGDTLYAMAFAPDECVLATIGSDGDLRSHVQLLMWDVASPAKPTIATGFYAPGEVTGLAVLSNRLVVTAAGKGINFTPRGQVDFWDASKKPRQWFRKPSPVNFIGAAHQPEVLTVTVSKSGGTLAAATGRKLALWNINNPAQPARISEISHNFEYMHTAAFSPDGQLIATADHGQEGRVILWDITNPRVPSRIGNELTGLAKQSQQVAFSPDSRILATAAGGLMDREVTAGSVLLWHVMDPAHPTRITELAGLTGLGLGIAFSPDGRTLATYGESPGSVILWNID